jgi:hypothetical protein
MQNSATENSAPRIASASDVSQHEAPRAPVYDPSGDDTMPNAWIPVQPPREVPRAPERSASVDLDTPIEHRATREPEIADSVPARPLPPAPPVSDLPPISMALPADSGLVMVETAHTAVAPDEAPVAHARRVRPPRTVIADEPLQMVETTHKDLPPA